MLIPKKIHFGEQRVELVETGEKLRVGRAKQVLTYQVESQVS